MSENDMNRRLPDPLNNDILLRDITESDLPIFFEQQLDPDANYMAAYAARDPADWNAFMAQWTRILGDETSIKKTILFEGNVVGQILNFEQFGKPSVAYWIGKKYWGKGIATRALAAFLGHVKVRPLYARVVKDNIGSRRVLEKCGFTIYGEDKGYSNVRGKEVEEFILRLSTTPIAANSSSCLTNALSLNVILDFCILVS